MTGTLRSPDSPDVYTVTGPTAVEWLANSWPDLYRRDWAATPYAHPGWLLGWAAHLPPGSGPLLLLALDDRLGIAAALPLARTSRPDGTTLITVLAPAGEYNGPVGPRAGGHDVAAVLADSLTALAQHGAVRLTNIPLNSALGRELAARPAWRHTIAETAVVLLPWDRAALRSSDRRQHDRRDRRLAAAGHRITYQRARLGPGRAGADAVRVLERLHAARWPAEDGAGPRPDWAAILHRIPPEDGFVGLLLLDGRPVAAQLVLTRYTGAYSALAAMDPAWSHLAVGHALQRLLIADLTAHGCTARVPQCNRLDLGPTRPEQRSYKSQYGPLWGKNATFALDSTPAAELPRPAPLGRYHNPENPESTELL